VRISRICDAVVANRGITGTSDGLSVIGGIVAVKLVLEGRLEKVPHLILSSRVVTRKSHRSAPGQNQQKHRTIAVKRQPESALKTTICSIS
jgi:hypothetical protein